MKAHARRLSGSILAGTLFLMPSLAIAHPGHGSFNGSESATSQFLHPFMTADHLVPALAAGVVVVALAKLLFVRRRS